MGGNENDGSIHLFDAIKDEYFSMVMKMTWIYMYIKSNCVTCVFSFLFFFLYRQISHSIINSHYIDHFMPEHLKIMNVITIFQSVTRGDCCCHIICFVPPRFVEFICTINYGLVRNIRYGNIVSKWSDFCQYIKTSIREKRSLCHSYFKWGFH